MNNQTSSLKTWIWIGAIIAVAGIGYFYWEGGHISPSSLAGVSPAAALSARTSAQSSTLDSIKVNADFFNDATFNSLIDNTVKVPEQSVGRPNPFAPIPGEATSTPPATTGR